MNVPQKGSNRCALL